MTLPPATDVLEAELARLLGDSVTVGRSRDEGSGRSEPVTCVLTDGRRVELFCKYESAGSSPHSNVRRESIVYAEVLAHLRHLPHATCHGTWESDGVFALVLSREQGEVLDGYADPRLPAAAEWLGEFHRWSEERFGRSPPPRLPHFDADHHGATLRRAVAATGTDALVRAADDWDRAIAPLMRERPCVVHGDFYPHNLMHAPDGSIRPVDWELGGIDVGEADLATLTDAQPDDLVAECEDAYRQARSPGGAPAEVGRVLAAARLCLAAYNLAHPGTISDRERAHYLLQVRRAVTLLCP